jgi:phage-related protein (TIGR01555 family)
MARRNKKIEKPQETKPVQYNAKDAFENQLARLGVNSPNLMSATNYPLTRLTRDYNLMNSLYRSHWIIKKIINTIPEDMTKNWVDVTAELTPEQMDRFNKLEQKTLVKEKILEGLMWGRLYGGAAIVIMIEGHEEILDQPLELDDIMPNSFKGLMVVDRWSGIFPDIKLVSDINDPEFGLPETYEVRDIGTERLLIRIHHSRILRCIGRKLPFWEDLAEIHWGSSEVEHVFDELVKRDNTSWNIASLVFQANLLVNKIEGFEQILATNDTQMQQQLYNVKSAQNQMRNNNGMLLIGAQEDITALQYGFGGLNDIHESFMLDIAGAAEIPVTKLFGRSPAGMNSTGESDLQNYYDMIAQQQETVLRPKLNKLYPIMFMSEFGYVPDDLDFKMNPVQTPTEDKCADIVGKKSQSILEAFRFGVISQKIALRELHELSYTTNMFTSITDEDIENADNSLQPDDISGLSLGSENLPPLRQHIQKSESIEQDQSLNEENNMSLPTETSAGNNLTKRLSAKDSFNVLDSEWEENKHPRNENGQFGHGNGGSGEHQDISPHKIKEVNKITNKAKFEELVDKMKKEGWQGRPILVLEKNGKFDAITGSHRLFAAREAKLNNVPTITIKESNNKEHRELWNDLEKSTDDDNKIRIVKELYDEGEINKKSYELMEKEIDINTEEYKEWSGKEEKRLTSEKIKKEEEKKKIEKKSMEYLPEKRDGYSDSSKTKNSSIFKVSSFYKPEDFKKDPNPKQYYTIKKIDEIAESFPPNMSNDEIKQVLWEKFGKYNKNGFYIKSANLFLPVDPKKLIS